MFRCLVRLSKRANSYRRHLPQVVLDLHLSLQLVRVVVLLQILLEEDLQRHDVFRLDLARHVHVAELASA